MVLPNNAYFAYLAISAIAEASGVLLPAIVRTAEGSHSRCGGEGGWKDAIAC